MFLRVRNYNFKCDIENCPFINDVGVGYNHKLECHTEQPEYLLNLDHIVGIRPSNKELDGPGLENTWVISLSDGNFHRLDEESTKKLKKVLESKNLIGFAEVDPNSWM